MKPYGMLMELGFWCVYQLILCFTCSAQVAEGALSSGPASAINAGWALNWLVYELVLALSQMHTHKSTPNNPSFNVHVSGMQSQTVDTLRCNRQGRGRCDHLNARRRTITRLQQEKNGKEQDMCSKTSGDVKPFMTFMNVNLFKRARTDNEP